jgi:hypothetical protein
MIHLKQFEGDTSFSSVHPLTVGDSYEDEHEVTTKHVHIVPCTETHAPGVVFMQQPTWNFLGNRCVEAHIGGNAQDKERAILEIGISFAAIP